MADEIHTQPWLVEMAIEAKSKADQEELGIALAKLAAEDPSFRVAIGSESGRTMLMGMDELHLDTKVDILKRTHKIEVTTHFGLRSECGLDCVLAARGLQSVGSRQVRSGSRPPS
jgi:hypothetical protein